MGISILFSPRLDAHGLWEDVRRQRAATPPPAPDCTDDFGGYVEKAS
jgi:hypothetical protein